MTWIMFDGKILCPETGAYFKVVKTIPYSTNNIPTQPDICVYYQSNNDSSFLPNFESELEAQHCFEELKKMLLPFDGLIGRSYKDCLNEDK